MKKNLKIIIKKLLFFIREFNNYSATCNIIIFLKVRIKDMINIRGDFLQISFNDL